MTNDSVQKYISSVLTEKPDIIYDPLDFKSVRTALYNNSLESVKKRFPLYNDRYSLEIEDLKYDDPEDFPLKVQKQAVLEGKTLGRRLRGSWVLRDVNTNKIVQKTGRMTILRVPYLTERGTYIRNGNEYTFNHIMRLEPGVYARRKDDDTVLAQINARQGTGSRVDLVFKPSSGTFYFQKGTVNAPAYKVLSDYGVSDDDMKKVWGEDLFKINQEAGMTTKAAQSAEKFYGN